MTTTHAATTRHHWVPVHHRWLGLDRRTIPHALVVLALVALWTVVLPKVDSLTPYDDEVQAGDRLALTESVVLTPTVGWEVARGFRVEPGEGVQQTGPAVLSARGVTMQVSTGDFTGTPDALLSQIDKVTTRYGEAEGFQVSQERVSLTTDAGVVGVAQAFASARVQGLIAALVIDGTGVEVQVVGPPDQMAAVGDEITSMVESIRSSGKDAS